MPGMRKIRKVKQRHMDIRIIVNDLEEKVPSGMTISGLIEHFKEGDTDLIVEINGQYIYPRDYDAVIIQENDRVEFINPNLGG